MKSKRQNSFLDAYKRGRDLAFLDIEELIKSKLLHSTMLKKRKIKNSVFSRAAKSSRSAVGGNIADRLMKSWITRRKKYGKSGRHKFSWDTSQGGQYYARRYYKTGSLGKKHGAGKGGGFRRHIHV